MTILTKICGITSAGDATAAVEAGADWIGLNFVAGPRRIGLDAAEGILSALNRPTCAVALVALPRTTSLPPIVAELRALGIRRLQVYGDADPRRMNEAASLGFDWIHVQHVTGEPSLAQLAERLAGFQASRPSHVLLDSAAPGKHGGTGVTQDWDELARLLAPWRSTLPPILLAGGLTPANVAEAIAIVRPDGVDVSSGVESEPGRKSPPKMKEFVSAAHSARPQS